MCLFHSSPHFKRTGTIPSKFLVVFSEKTNRKVYSQENNMSIAVVEKWQAHQRRDFQVYILSLYNANWSLDGQYKSGALYKTQVSHVSFYAVCFIFLLYSVYNVMKFCSCKVRLMHLHLSSFLSVLSCKSVLVRGWTWQDKKQTHYSL